MPTFDAKLKGTRSFLANSNKFATKTLVDHNVKALQQIGKQVRDEAKRNVSRAPPEHPQIKTGALYKSIKYRVWKSTNRQTLSVFSPLAYSFYLEVGFKSQYSGKVGPYPWLRPALRSVTNDMKSEWRM